MAFDLKKLVTPASKVAAKTYVGLNLPGSKTYDAFKTLGGLAASKSKTVSQTPVQAPAASSPVKNAVTQTAMKGAAVAPSKATASAPSAAPASSVASTSQMPASSFTLPPMSTSAPSAQKSTSPSVSSAAPAAPTAPTAQMPLATASGGGNVLQNSQYDNVMDALRKKVSQYSTTSDEEKHIQDELANFRENAKLGEIGLEGQGRGIPLSLIRGQQGKLAAQAEIGEQTLLEKLAAASAARQANLAAATNEYNFATDQQARQDRLTAPTTVGNQILQFDPATGQYKTLYSAPEQTGEAKRYEVGGALVDADGNVIYQGSSGSSGDGFSLSPGQTRYDAFGNLIASAPDNASTKPQSAEMLKLQSNVQSGLDSLAIIRATIGDGSRPIIANQGYKGAEANLIDIIGRLRSGGAISQDEEKRFRSLLPTVRDSANVAQQKLGTIENLLQNTLQTSGSASGTSQPPAGWDNDSWQYYLQSGGDPSAFSNDLSMSQNGSTLGSLSEKYESGGNPGAIGYDSTGGYSYGTYQLAHNNAQNFVNQSPFKDAFSGLKFNSPQWQQRWKEVAQKYPQQFAEAQKQYIAKTHFEPQVNKLASLGINVNNLPDVVKDAIWSTAVQHGANTDVVAKAFAKLTPNATPADVLKAIYNERWSGGARFASSTPQVKQSVYNRFFGPQGELAMALQRLNSQNIA